MNSVKYLKNLFISLAVLSGFTIPLVLVLIYCEINFTGTVSGLINTLVATLYAIMIAVFIYWRQQKDKYEALLKSLIIYLTYLIKNLPEVTYSKEQLPDESTEIPVNIVSVNKSLLNKILESGYFNDIIEELVKLQNAIEFYYLAVELYFNKDAETLKDLESRLNMIKNTQEIIQEESEKILAKLD